MTMTKVTFQLDGKRMQASVGLDACNADFLLLTAIACVQALARDAGREGAWEKFERGFNKAMQSQG